MVKIYSLSHPSSTRLYIGKTCRTLKKRWKDTSYSPQQIFTRSRLNNIQREEIFEKLKNKESVKNILKEYPISQTQIYRFKIKHEK